MDHSGGAGLPRADCVDFDLLVRLEFRGAKISYDGGLLVMREMDAREVGPSFNYAVGQ